MATKTARRPTAASKRFAKLTSTASGRARMRGHAQTRTQRVHQAKADALVHEQLGRGARGATQKAHLATAAKLRAYAQTNSQG